MKDENWNYVLIAIPKVKRIISFQLISLPQIFVNKQVGHSTETKQFPQTFAYTLYHTPCTILHIWASSTSLSTYHIYSHLTYTLATSPIVVHTLYVTTYHESHALVHVSTCTCTFQPALIQSYLLTHTLGHSRPHCTYLQCIIPRSSTQKVTHVIFVNLFSMYTQFCIPYHSP